MQGLKNAIQFLTILPLGTSSSFDAGRMLPFFPLVGLLIGGLLVGVDYLACLWWNRIVASLLDVFFLIWITGALHLDGVGDTADGLYGQRSREDALAIMKDSRIGAMGSIAILSVVLLKWIALSSVIDGRSLVLLTVPAFGRCAQLVGMRSLPYGRQEGLGRTFIEAPMHWYGFLLILLPVGGAAFLGIQGLVLLAGFILVTLGTLAFYKRRLGCITGDMLGALCEVCETGLFLLASLTFLNQGAAILPA